MSKYEGVIEKVYEKNGRHSLLMDDDNWYGLNRHKPAANDGDYARFEYEMNGKYRNVVENTLEVKPGTGETKKAKGGGGGVGYKEEAAMRKAYWDAKELRDIDTQKRISYNGALNSAIAIINLAVSNEVVKIGGKAGDKIDTITAMTRALGEDIFRVFEAVPADYDEIIAGGGVPAAGKVPEDVEAPIDEPDPTEGEDDGWGNG
jgi:hypothetical protein